MATIKISFELDDLVNDGKISADDLVECLCDDHVWAANHLSSSAVDELKALVSSLDEA